MLGENALVRCRRLYNHKFFSWRGEEKGFLSIRMSFLGGPGESGCTKGCCFIIFAGTKMAALRLLVTSI